MNKILRTLLMAQVDFAILAKRGSQLGASKWKNYFGVLCQNTYNFSWHCHQNVEIHSRWTFKCSHGVIYLLIYLLLFLLKRTNYVYWLESNCFLHGPRKRYLPTIVTSDTQIHTLYIEDWALRGMPAILPSIISSICRASFARHLLPCTLSATFSHSDSVSHWTLLLLLA